MARLCSLNRWVVNVKSLGSFGDFGCWLNIYSSIFVVWKCVLRGEVSFVLRLLFELLKDVD